MMRHNGTDCYPDMDTAVLIESLRKAVIVTFMTVDKTIKVVTVKTKDEQRKWESESEEGKVRK